MTERLILDRLTLARRRMLAALLAFSAAGAAQALTTEFPQGATTPDAKSIRQHLVGKVFKATPGDGNSWRLQYRESDWFINTRSGFSGGGAWHAEDGKLCGELRSGDRAGGNCSEVRMHDGHLLLKRNTNGEVVRLEPD